MFSQLPMPVEAEGGDDRHREIVAAAIALIAEKGMEGLRIREVAERVGINNATLHYYFKTKETLIEAVVKTIVHDLVSTHAPGRVAAASPRAELEAHLADILYQLRHTPTRFVVLGELLMRSHHEPAVHAILRRTDEEWHAFLVDILQRGIAAGEFAAGTDVGSISHLIMMILKGSTLQLNASAEQIEQVMVQVRRWLAA